MTDRSTRRDLLVERVATSRREPLVLGLAMAIDDPEADVEPPVPWPDGEDPLLAVISARAGPRRSGPAPRGHRLGGLALQRPRVGPRPLLPGDGDPARVQANVERMLANVTAFLDLSTFRAATMGEYLFRSPAAR
ncbi:MAG: hypothetical protein ACR2JF_10600 [Iamia sp.]